HATTPTGHRPTLRSAGGRRRSALEARWPGTGHIVPPDRVVPAGPAPSAAPARGPPGGPRARRRGTGEPRAGPQSAPVPAAFASAGPAAGVRAPDRQRLENTIPAWPARGLAAPPR